MSDQPKLYIAGVGMITPVGFDAVSTAAAVRAGISAFQSTGFNLDDDNHICMARVPREALDEGLNESLLPDDYSARQIRLLQLATLALTQLLPWLPRNETPPLFLAGPEQLSDEDQPINDAFLENLNQQIGMKLDLSMSRVLTTGRAGSLATIHLAFRYLAESSHQFAIIGGVDTYYDGRVLQLLVKDERLLVGGNMDGFIPGEGAGFILLSKHEISISKNAARMVCVFEPGLANEAGHRGSSEPYRGDGLASAVTQALDNAQTAKIRTLYSSMNGENFFAKEHGVAMVRNGERFEDTMKTEHPADCFGDLGAAAGPVMTGLGALYLLDDRVAAPCIVCCSSDKAPRAAMVLQT